jgi:hypothetical protein
MTSILRGHLRRRIWTTSPCHPLHATFSYRLHHTASSHRARTSLHGCVPQNPPALAAAAHACDHVAPWFLAARRGHGHGRGRRGVEGSGDLGRATQRRSLAQGPSGSGGKTWRSARAGSPPPRPPAPCLSVKFRGGRKDSAVAVAEASLWPE